MIDVLKKQSKPYLEKILEFNIIIYDYQMGLIKREMRNSLFYESKERSFLKCCMKHKDAIKFVNWMNSYTDKISYCIHGDKSEEFDKEYYEGDITRASSIVVSIEGLSIYPNIEEFIPLLKVPLVLTQETLDYEKTRAHLQPHEDVTFIMCIDPVYGRSAIDNNGLYGDILKGLDRYV